MRCTRQNDLHRFPWPGLTADQRRDLRAHSADCAACRGTIHRLESARRVLVDETEVVHPSENVRTWAAIEERTSSRWFPTWAPGVGAATAALVLLAIFVWAPREAPTARTHAALPANQTIRVVERRTFRDERVTIHADVGATITFGALGPIRLLDLTSGRIALEIEPLSAPETVIVETPAATIEVIGTVFTVEVGAFTSVGVARGRVRVTPRDGPSIELVPGQRYTSKPPPVAATNDPELPPPVASKPVTKPSMTERNRSDLARARSLIWHDADGARRIADAVLGRAARGAEEVDALAVIADAHRRSGRRRIAATYYERVAQHPDGTGYAEEALLWRARVLMDAGDPKNALTALEIGERRFKRGVLAPERAALAAAGWLRLDNPSRAADALERADAGSLAVQIAILDVTRVLVDVDRARARQLLARIGSSPASASVKREAAALQKIVGEK